MNEGKVTRINELYKKAKSVGLTPEEKKEQEILRKEYVEGVRRSLRGSLECVKIVDPDGNDVTPKRKLN